MANATAIYGEIYNYYQNIYAPKTNSRYDAHNKSDLKKVYNSIVNDNKEKPVYLLDSFSEIQDYTIGLKESAMQFGRDISAMGGTDSGNLFSQKSVFSSDENVAEASSLSSSRIMEEEDSVNLVVTSLAKPQVNTGSFLISDELNLETGTYSFDVSTSASNYELQFGIGDNDTNYSIQTRLARLINNAAIGLNAKVLENDDGMHALSISSVSPGAVNGEPPFVISDENTSKNKGVIDYLGIRNATQSASWAEYSVDGENYSSPDNAVEINGVYSVKLKATTDEDGISIGIRPELDSFRENIKGVVEAYNRFIKKASEYSSSQPKSNVLLDSMKRMENYYSSALEKFGISQGFSGTLELDEEVLDNLWAGGATEADVSDFKDFTKSAYRKISHVQLDPMDYVDKRIVAYKNPTVSHFANPYITSAYSGMIFNSYM